jgi:hypothetical protein
MYVTNLTPGSECNPIGGMMLAVATYSHVSGKKLNGGWWGCTS